MPLSLNKEYCTSCGKPLGSTEEKCFECGGEDPRLPKEERLQSAVWWKVELGVNPKLIDQAVSEAIENGD